MLRPVAENKLLIFSFLVLALAACETATKTSELDLNAEDRAFAKLEYGKDVDFKYSIIADTRSRFDHEMSKPPRSFHANAADWDLSGYTGEALHKKRQELQRLLALKGVEPLTQVVILGAGLKGNGEEFLVASTLASLGITRISFMSQSQVKKALTAKSLPPVENAPPWDKPLGKVFTCQQDPQGKKRAEVSITKSGKGPAAYNFKPEQVFLKNLKVKRNAYPKSLKTRVTSPGSYWGYGLSLYFHQQGRDTCVL